jgi:ASC-1-like (ASCH) protein
MVFLGLKTVEGIFKGMQEYKTFEEYLKTEGLDKCLPGITKMKDDLSVYFTKEDDKEFSVFAIGL